MKIGTKSVLFGAHCWFIHPWFVALAWWKLFGFPRDLRLWFAFFLHDLGYWSCPDMDGEEGEKHVEWGALQMYRHFDSPGFPFPTRNVINRIFGDKGDKFWYEFSLYHSRFYAKRDGANPSPLCIADKLAVALEPWWLYLPRVHLSGEVWEYMEAAQGNPGSKYNGEPHVGSETSAPPKTTREWFERMTEYLRKWVEEHKDGRADTWTPAPINQSADEL